MFFGVRFSLRHHHFPAGVPDRCFIWITGVGVWFGFSFLLNMAKALMEERRCSSETRFDMLARWLRLILLFELFSYCFVGLCLVRLAGWQPFFAVLVMLLFAATWRAVPVALTYLQARAQRLETSPTPPFDTMVGLRALVREYAAFSMLTFTMPLERLLMSADAPRKSAVGQQPILLIHGYCCNRGMWWWLKSRLEVAQRSVGTLTLEPLFIGIDAYTEQIARRVTRLCDESGAAQVTLVGFGMGGLACLAYLRRYGDERVARMVTIATAHQGAAVARNWPGRNAREMDVGSRWLQELAASPISVPCLSVYSVADDCLVTPAMALRNDMEGQSLLGGHLSLAFSPAVLKILLAVTAGD